MQTGKVDVFEFECIKIVTTKVSNDTKNNVKHILNYFSIKNNLVLN